MTRKDTVWQSADVVHEFLEGMRAAIPQAAEQLDVMLRLIQAARPDLHNFLDLGCGDGILARAVLSRYPQAQGVLLDFSEPMLSAARQHLDLPNITFVAQDYGLPAWVDSVRIHAPYDAIVSGYSIHHQPDARKRELYAELYDLLKPGGIFINIEHVASPSSWGESLFDDLFIDSQYAYFQSQGINKTHEEVAHEFHNRPHKEANLLAPVDLQCAWLREIGFADADCYLKFFELAVFGGIRPHE